MSNPERTASFLLKPVRRACKEFDLLDEGDRVAVAVSSGKDSRALLELLLRLQRQFRRHQGQIRANLWRAARRAMEF